VSADGPVLDLDTPDADAAGERVPLWQVRVPLWVLAVVALVVAFVAARTNSR
jgi:ribose/xylose/arabinose/galactoside ABC-type transport system permease subunit